jgi:hypothetical protein
VESTEKRGPPMKNGSALNVSSKKRVGATIAVGGLKKKAASTVVKVARIVRGAHARPMPVQNPSRAILTNSKIREARNQSRRQLYTSENSPGRN